MQRIKIYGERNVGTNYLEQLILLNFDIDMLTGAFAPQYHRWPFRYEMVRDVYFKLFFSSQLGWKHAMAPSKQCLQGNVADGVLFLTLTKNPYAWLLSMFKRPYHAKIKYADFESFLLHPYVTVDRENYADDFVTPMQMWNQKNKSYLELMAYTQGLNLKYEDFLANPERQMRKIQKILKCPFKSGDFVHMSEAAKKQDEHLDFAYYKNYYLNKGWVEKLTATHISIINEHLDSEVMQSLNYDYIFPENLQ